MAPGCPDNPVAVVMACLVRSVQSTSKVQARLKLAGASWPSFCKTPRGEGGGGQAILQGLSGIVAPCCRGAGICKLTSDIRECPAAIIIQMGHIWHGAHAIRDGAGVC